MLNETNKPGKTTEVRKATLLIPGEPPREVEVIFERLDSAQKVL